eukprot:Skav223890  [mRNA]  locus=scaffold1226:713680:717680:- [translate_table: standard]
MAQTGDAPDIESGLLSEAGEVAQAASSQAPAASGHRRVPPELAMQNACAMCCFASLLCLMTIFSACLLAYLLIEFVTNWKNTCDEPLQLWVVVVLLIAAFNLALNQHDGNGSRGARFFCCWSFDPENPERMPARVKVYNMMVPMFTAMWNMLGLFWVSMAHDPRDGFYAGGNNTVHLEEEVSSRCTEVAPGLLSAIRVYAGFNLFYCFFILMGVTGLSRILRYLKRRDLRKALGPILDNFEDVGIDDPATVDHPQCPICLQDWRRGDYLLKAKACGHIFHEEHIGEWLMVRKSCPVCRDNMGDRSTEPQQHSELQQDSVDEDRVGDVDLRSHAAHRDLRSHAATAAARSFEGFSVRSALLSLALPLGERLVVAGGCATLRGAAAQGAARDAAAGGGADHLAHAILGGREGGSQGRQGGDNDGAYAAEGALLPEWKQHLVLGVGTVLGDTFLLDTGGVDALVAA